MTLLLPGAPTIANCPATATLAPKELPLLLLESYQQEWDVGPNCASHCGSGNDQSQAERFKGPDCEHTSVQQKKEKTTATRHVKLLGHSLIFASCYAEDADGGGNTQPRLQERVSTLLERSLVSSRFAGPSSRGAGQVAICDRRVQISSNDHSSCLALPVQI